jgi:hypothetical protein
MNTVARKLLVVEILDGQVYKYLELFAQTLSVRKVGYNSGVM